MEVLSPKPIKITGITITFTHTSTFEYTDPVLNVPMTKRITSLTFGQMGINPPPVELSLAKEMEPRLIQYAGMQALIKSCVDNAEDIKDRLLQIVLRTIKHDEEEKRVAIMKMDFMSLKKWFMEDVRKSKIYQRFEEYSSTKKLKSFSQAFNTFIIDRNKYTHGQLCFIKPEYNFALEYIESPSQQQKQAHIDTEILLSYNNCYKEILKVITEYNIIHQNRVLGR